MGNPGKARTVMAAASAKAAEGTPLLGAGGRLPECILFACIAE